MNFFKNKFNLKAKAVVLKIFAVICTVAFFGNVVNAAVCINVDAHYSGGDTYSGTAAASDDGTTWKHLLDDSTASPGVLPQDPSVVLADSGSGDESLTWSVPALNFPEGSYLVRIDFFRGSETLHYATHSASIFIDR